MARRRSYRDYDYGWGYFPPSKPREAKGGIKAQSKRGTFGESWWAKRWISVLESFNIGARLGRGRSYARQGQVLSIDIAEGAVTARVQGSRPKPYAVKIQVETLSKTDWKKVAAAMAGQAIFAAKLLAGEMPQDIEQAFESAKLSLFPKKSRDLKTDCSCPDWSNPCKHIAAVYYLLGEEFDRDPFLIFRLRGIEREELVRLVGAEPAAGKKDVGEGEVEPQAEHEESAVREPLPAVPAAFWKTCQVPDDFFGEVRTPALPAALVKRLGSLPFWRAETRFLDAMEEVYRTASPAGVDVFVGEVQG
ncbi:MAG: SWIM zinc finger family protein [Pirellulales bacterium]|nr:SWIM zinc finger family protein [Pirellulales bacterium]